MTFSGKADSGFSVTMSSSASGSGAVGPSPMELMLLSVGGCTAIDVISILRKKRQDVTDLKVEMDGTQSEDYPRVFTKIAIKYIVYGREIKPAAVERAIELSSEKYCPAQAMAAKTASISHSYEIIEEE